MAVFTDRGWFSTFLKVLRVLIRATAGSNRACAVSSSGTVRCLQSSRRSTSPSSRLIPSSSAPSPQSDSHLPQKLEHMDKNLSADSLDHFRRPDSYQAEPGASI